MRYLRRDVLKAGAQIGAASAMALVYISNRTIEYFDSFFVYFV
jgi:hypothetical protein